MPFLVHDGALFGNRSQLGKFTARHPSGKFYLLHYFAAFPQKSRDIEIFRLISGSYRAHGIQ
jgi:hypothetical protein